jgi:alkanesulfonate monooxygenase SsuD/methylene tetrahydromethanopterin reductase-like flavin-dependent oxidoreductase (luciferase family)
MRFSITGTMNLAWWEVAEAARLAEELGFEAFYTSDHLFSGIAGFDPSVGLLDALGLVLALGPVTSTIRLGCLVSPVTYRHPVVLARALQTADHVTGGRVDIGIGAGWVTAEHDAFGIPYPGAGERLAMLEDACATISALWHGDGPVSVGGRFPLHDATLAPRPVQPVAPIFVAGASERALRTSARWAMRWNCSGSPSYLGDRVARLRELEAEEGRSPGSVESTVMLGTVLSDDAQVLDTARAAMARVTSGGDRTQARNIQPGESADAAMYIGPLAGLASRVAAYGDAGVDRVILTVPRPWNPDAMRRLAAAAGVSPGAPRSVPRAP